MSEQIINYEYVTELIYRELEQLSLDLLSNNTGRNVNTSPNNIETNNLNATVEDHPRDVLNPLLPENPLNNIILSFEDHPSPTADECVIRQRGRRKISMINWSPSKRCSAKNPFQKTPTKVSANQPTTSMVLRSSPRKRLILDDGIQSPKKSNLANGTNSDCQAWFGTPVVKKIRVDEKPLARSSTDIPLELQLRGLSQAQLVQIIMKLVNNDPNAEKQIRNEFPMPDIMPMEQQLAQVKSNIFKSLPTSRFKTDSAAYSRIVIHLQHFKKLITNQSKLLHHTGHWDALINYIKMAWTYVRATPVWESNSHNLIRKQCFKILTYHLSEALKFGGIKLGSERLEDLERDIKEWSKDYQDILTCANCLNQLMMKTRKL